VRAATQEEIRRWDELVATNPDGGNVLQGLAFAETKAKFGWVPKYVMHDKIAALYLTRRAPGLGEIWYAPKGPGIASLDQLVFVTKDIKDAKPSFLVEIEPELPDTPKHREMLRAGGLTKIRDIQYNRATVVVDLKPTEDEILASFKQKARYNIRLAAKKGVTVEPVDLTDESINKMYELTVATSQRAGFFLRSKDYYETFWREHVDRGCGQLFFASFQGKVLAGIFATYLGKKGLYKDGASSREHSELQAPYLLQWEVMRWLKGKGVTEYDLHGVPPEGAQDHPLQSLVQFKTGFNPNTVQYVGTWCLPLKPAACTIWDKFGRRATMSYHHRVKGQLFY
jgi:lipid II:glycine glycyltransferase (peptidoglycan interpeptide bridge formation enzyme)